MSRPKKQKSSKSKAVPQKAKKLPPLYFLVALALCVAAAAAFLIAYIVVENRPPQIKFIPPDFDTNALSGIPDIPDELSYRELYQDGMAYSAGICGKVKCEGQSFVLYFTNPKGNSAWLKLRIFDGQGDILGESGLIKPDEYLRSVEVSEVPAAGAALILRIMAYEPDTYYSLGSFSVETTLFE